jgi:hypothetical protein
LRGGDDGLLLRVRPLPRLRSAVHLQPAPGVPSVRVGEAGVRKPICASCVELANPLREERGLEPIRPLAGAYEVGERSRRTILTRGGTSAPDPRLPPHAFRRPTRVRSACRVRLYLPDEEDEILDDAPVVIVSELADNPGTSVKDAIEQIAAEVMDAHRASPSSACRSLRRAIPAGGHQQGRGDVRPARLQPPRGPGGRTRGRLAQGGRLAHLEAPRPPCRRGPPGIPGVGV